MLVFIRHENRAVPHFRNLLSPNPNAQKHPPTHADGIFNTFVTWHFTKISRIGSKNKNCYPLWCVYLEPEQTVILIPMVRKSPGELFSFVHKWLLGTVYNAPSCWGSMGHFKSRVQISWRQTRSNLFLIWWIDQFAERVAPLNLSYLIRSIGALAIFRCYFRQPFNGKKVVRWKDYHHFRAGHQDLGSNDRRKTRF